MQVAETLVKNPFSSAKVNFRVARYRFWLVSGNGDVGSALLL